MGDFSAPADNLVHETVGYVNAQLDNVKLRTIKGLSQCTSAIARLLIIFIMVGALVTALSFAIILLLGEMIGSYALAAFIMSGILLIIIIILIALRHCIFKNSFIGMYTDIFYQRDTRPLGLDSREDLDEAIRRAGIDIKKQEDNLSNAYENAKNSYSIKHLFNQGLESIGLCDDNGDIKLGSILTKAFGFIFGKKKDKEA